MALSPNEWPVLYVRRKIAEQPTKVQEMIRRGEQTIDDALTFPHRSHFGTVSDQWGLNVFDLSEKVGDTVRQLLKELYEAVGYSVTWECLRIDDRNTEPNVVILHPRT